jgi:NADPH:quinone reductase-like Zn-dependent oxidoreductase
MANSCCRSEQFKTVGHVDVVFDLIGGPTQARSWARLGQGGRLVSTAMPPDAEIAKAKGATGHFVFAPPSGIALAEIGEQIAFGKLKPLPVALELPLADAVQAHELGETGKTGGKMVLTTD